MQSGLATRVETRTLVLFIACALIPVAAFSAFGYFTVTHNFRESAQRQLNATAKNYGLLIYERLQQVDQELTRLADRYQRGELTEEQLERASDRRAIIRAVSSSKSKGATLSAPSTFTRRLLVNKRGNHAQVLIELIARNESSLVSLEAQVSSDYLWNADAVLTSDAVLCVFDENGTGLNCADESATTTSTALVSRWPLFLSATYQIPQWTVQAQVPEATALQALRAFKWILPATAGLAIAIAVLLASIFIRRSHAPLRLLADAARRIGEGRFGRTVSVSSSDEYGRLARAFNQMSRGLREQFQLLRVLARVDRTILARGGTQPAIRYLLRRLPGLLNCEHAGVLFYGNGSAQLIACSGHLTPIRCIDIASTMSGLRANRDIERRTHLDADARHVLEHFDSSASNTFYFVPVLIKNELRAHLIIGSAGESASMRRLQDIAQRIAVALDNEQWERTLWEQAHTDSLTGLPNRLALHQHLNQAAQGAHAIGTVFFLDLDRFKTVNDSLGHSLGDSLLQQVASRWKAHLPSSSLLARVGGDEFVAVVPQTHSRQETEQLGQALIAALREPCQLNEMRYVAQASIGVAMYPDHGTDAETLLRHADIALYRAKSGGRGRARMFDASMSGDLSARLEIEHQLRDAIREGRIHPHYQPKLNTQGELVGVEALARWQKADGKWISPGTFIPIAEESGLIAPMGELLLRNVCKQMRDWRDRGIPVAHVAVNISMVQMRDPAFADFVLRCLAETGIEGAALELELTESLFAENTTDVARQLTRLAQAGVRVAIDDFGTGFSSMSLLRQYPIHSLKIDRSFVIECHHSVESRALLKALIDVGHALHLQVVAEGVEEITQLSVLHELNCDVLQGYLFAPALSAQALESFINDGEPIRETLRSAG